MAKLIFHPNAYLNETRNIKQGLASRTKILKTLEKTVATAKTIANETRLNYSVVLHHLHLLDAEKIVTRKTYRRPYVWELTGVGQQRLNA
ncbi:MAG: hypothetical protein ACLFU9_04150 [Candidatus Bathyarchaeia archaeon]